MRELFNKMPANSRNIDQRDFFAVWLWLHLTYADTKSFRYLFFYQAIPEFFDIAYPHTQHKIFGKVHFIVLLQDKFASVFFKAYISPCIPTDGKSKFLEELLGALKIAA